MNKVKAAKDLVSLGQHVIERLNKFSFTKTFIHDYIVSYNEFCQIGSLLYPTIRLSRLYSVPCTNYLAFS